MYSACNSSRIADTSYSDILGLKPDTGDAAIRQKLEYLICYAFDLERNGRYKQEARKLQIILKHVHSVLLDPQLRQDYDQNGSKLEIGVFEIEKFQFEAILRYMLNCRLPEKRFL